MKKEKTIKETILSVKKGKTLHISMPSGMNITGYRQEAIRLNHEARKDGLTSGVAYTISVTKKSGYLSIINNLQ